jgi:predicted GH43/DUF377 family glycosyl hydrolase
MKWIKKGLIFDPHDRFTWATHSALQPTPILMSHDIIRVYIGCRDDHGVSRIGFVDLAADDPSKILTISKSPALNIGTPGTFDENGVVPCAVVKREDRLFLYYAGYQLGQKIRFYVFAGLAISEDGGSTFIRHQRVPILDRTDQALFFRVIHSIRFEGGVWKAWYGAGSKFIAGNHTTLPVYDIRTIESHDGINFDKPGQVCIPIKGEDEHRIGRPYVVKDGAIYRMFYGVGTKSKGYRLGYAESHDGLNWVRKDEDIGLDVSTTGWDSQMISYPSVIECNDRCYMFYNGNNYGHDGFGCAVLENW